MTSLRSAAIVLVLALSAFAVSCGDDADESPGESSTTTTLDPLLVDPAP
jgi:hypothetical protein